MKGEAEAVGSFVKLFDNDGYILVVAEDEPRIDAAVEQYLSSGHQRDTLLLLTLCDGGQYKVRASAINCWLLSTPETRRRAVEWEKTMAEETKANRQAAGLPWEDGADS